MVNSDTPIASAVVVQAKFNFLGKNNDELNFQKADLITLTQRPDGGWWEGTLNGMTGWFPCDYVSVVAAPVDGHQIDSSVSKQPLLTQNQASDQEKKIGFRSFIVADLIKTEHSSVKLLSQCFGDILDQIRTNNIVNDNDYSLLVGNYEQIIQSQCSLLQSLEETSEKASLDQSVGSCFMKYIPKAQLLFRQYCSNHPFAIIVIEENKDKLVSFLKSVGSSLMLLIQGLSQPFRRISQYSASLQDLERYLEDSHPDRGDTQRAAALLRDFSEQCSQIRKQREIQIEFKNATVHNWDGEPRENLGEPRYICPVSIVNELDQKEDRYVIVYSGHLLMMTVSSKLNGYAFKMLIPIGGLIIGRVDVEASVGPNGVSLKNGCLERPIEMNFQVESDLKPWLEVMEQLETVSIENPLSVISPSVPIHCEHVQNNLSPAVKPEVTLPPSPGQAELKKSSTLPPRLGQTSLKFDMKDSNRPSSPLGSVPENTGSTSVQHPYQPKLWSSFSLRPQPAPRGNFALENNVSAQTKVKLRKVTKVDVTETDIEDAQILEVIEAYSTSSKSSQKTSGSLLTSPKLIVAEDEKIFVEEMVGDEMIVREKTLVDSVYALRDDVTAIHEEIQALHKLMEKEQKARRRLEEICRRSIFSTQRVSTASTLEKV